MDYSKLTIPELKAEINRFKLKLPQKGSGSNGNLIKQDYIDVLTRSKQSDLLVGSQFLEKMPPEITRLALKKLNIHDILSFCQSSNLMKVKVCTESFWQDIAKDKLGITELAEFKTWQHLVSMMKYGVNDLFSIYQAYLHRLYTKKEAEAKIDDWDRIEYEGRDVTDFIVSEIQKYLDKKFKKLRYFNLTEDPTIFVDESHLLTRMSEEDAIKEVVLSQKYWVYYNGNEIKVFEKKKDSMHGLLLAHADHFMIKNAKLYFELSFY